MANKLTCFARGRPGKSEAICLDYDIAVQGRTFEEVEQLLGMSIDDYVESARQEPPDVRDRILRRAVPSACVSAISSASSGVIWRAGNVGMMAIALSIRSKCRAPPKMHVQRCDRHRRGAWFCAANHQSNKPPKISTFGRPLCHDRSARLR